MKIIKTEIQNLNFLLPLKSSLVVIGYFDGLHVYHQKLLSLAQKKALKENLKLVLITFDQKVSDYVAKKNNDLISQDTKFNFLKNNYQFDYCLVLKVDEKLVSMSKQKFLSFLDQKVGTKMIVAGQDFVFGAQCTGKVTDLVHHFGQKNVLVLKRHNLVSSTKLRKFLSKGKIKKNNLWLRRKLEIELKCQLSPQKQLEWSLIYPKTKLKVGGYQILNEANQLLTIQVMDDQKVGFVETRTWEKLNFKPGVYQFKLKKFLY